MPVGEVDLALSLATRPVYQISRLEDCLRQLGQMHPRLCPRQVLGVRMGLEAGEVLGLELPRADKRLVALVETDGCFADGVSVATGCWLGRRTLRLIDYGKVATTVVDVRTGRALRLWPNPTARLGAWAYAPDAASRWQAQLMGYQRMPPGELLCVQQVDLEVTLLSLVGRPGRQTCTICGEEILNARGLANPGGVRCRGCATSRRYYRSI